MKSVKLLSVKDGFSKNMFDTIPIKAEAESEQFAIQKIYQNRFSSF